MIQTQPVDPEEDARRWAEKAEQAERELSRFHYATKYPYYALSTSLKKLNKEFALTSLARSQARLDALRAKAASGDPLTTEEAEALQQTPDGIVAHQTDALLTDEATVSEIEDMLARGDSINELPTSFELQDYEAAVNLAISRLKEDLAELKSTSTLPQDLSKVDQLLGTLPAMVDALVALERRAIADNPAAPPQDSFERATGELAALITELRTHTSGAMMAPGVTCEPEGIKHSNWAFDMPIRARFALLGENDPDARRVQCIAKAEEQARVEARGFCRRFKGTLVEQGQGARLLNENLGYSLELEADGSCSIDFVTQVECRI